MASSGALRWEIEMPKYNSGQPPGEMGDSCTTARLCSHALHRDR